MGIEPKTARPPAKLYFAALDSKKVQEGIPVQRRPARIKSTPPWQTPTSDLQAEVKRNSFPHRPAAQSAI
jgi:hypothetical protein